MSFCVSSQGNSLIMSGSSLTILPISSFSSLTAYLLCLRLTSRYRCLTRFKYRLLSFSRDCWSYFSCPRLGSNLLLVSKVVLAILFQIRSRENSGICSSILLDFSSLPPWIRSVRTSFSVCIYGVSVDIRDE